MSSESARERGLRFAAEWDRLATRAEDIAILEDIIPTQEQFPPSALRSRATLYRTRARWLRHAVAGMGREADLRAALVRSTVLGVVASAAAVALEARASVASVKAAPSFLTSLPAVGPKGHRMIGVMPSEAVLDRGGCPAQWEMMQKAAEHFAEQATCAPPQVVTVTIGGSDEQ